MKSCISHENYGKFDNQHQRRGQTVHRGKFCNQVGMTVSGLYNVFTKQVLREGRIPFEIAVGRPSRATCVCNRMKTHLKN